MKKPVLRRVCIVFEDTGGSGFNVHLEGISDSRKAEIREKGEEACSAAERWGYKMFTIVGNLLQQSGAAKTIRDKTQPGQN